ncbi:MAG: universal stress protein [Desulfuromonadales bacterium]
MNFKDILVHIDNRPNCVSRLAVAIQLARQHQARLAGLYVIPHPYFASHHVDSQELAEAARMRFAQAVAEAQLESEWLCVDSLQSGLELSQIITLHAHYRDLLVISQTDLSAPDRTVPPDLPERAVLGSGRPVLIVPYAGEFTTFGRRVMLAWRGGPESSRALHDSLPLLYQAELVKVLSVQGPGGDESYKSHNADICHHLVYYGINAAGEKRVGGDLSVGDLLLNRCADEGIDLLVMGAFAQTRRGQQTLGDVGRYLLEFMTIPVLMSH